MSWRLLSELSWGVVGVPSLTHAVDMAGPISLALRLTLVRVMVLPWRRERASPMRIWSSSSFTQQVSHVGNMAGCLHWSQHLVAWLWPGLIEYWHDSIWRKLLTDSQKMLVGFCLLQGYPCTKLPSLLVTLGTVDHLRGEPSLLQQRNIVQIKYLYVPDITRRKRKLGIKSTTCHIQ